MAFLQNVVPYVSPWFANQTATGTLVSGLAISGSFTTSGVAIYNADGFAWSCNFTTGTPSGTLKVQGSNDNTFLDFAGQPGSTTWFDITQPTVLSTAVSATGNVVFNAPGQYYSWTRLVYTFTSGNTTVTARCTLKGTR